MFEVIINFFFRSFFQVVRVFVEVYLYFTKRLDNIVEISNVHVLYHYITYNVIKNNKNYKVVFSSTCDKKVQEHILDFKLNNDICLAAKNLIVNCHLNLSSSGDLMFDITEYVRYFCYYFDKDEKFDMFLNYLEYKHNIDLSLYKEITLNMNDFDFSEKVYGIKESRDMMFRDIFRKVR
jgi:hypothetical protein